MNLTPAQVTWAREQVKAARAAGVDDQIIDSQLRESLGVGLEEILSFSLRDAGRSLASGATLGFNDELMGGLAKLTGGDYTTARDEVRQNDAAARYASPIATAASEFAGGMAPAMLATPFAAAKNAGWVAKGARAAATSGLFGAAAGAGHSEAETPGGVAADAATTGALSAGIGGGLSLMGSAGGAVARRVRDAVNPRDAVLRAGATQLPANATKTLATQEAIAPGTAVAADLSPEMGAMASGVGADAATGMSARVAAEARVEQLRQTLTKFGQQYQQINRTLPVDTDLRKLLAEGAKQGIKKADKVLPANAKDVEFATLHRFRSNLLADLRHVKDNSMQKHEKKILAEKLTAWIEQHVPEITTLDKGNAFLNRALAAAKNTLKEVTRSSKNYARTSGYGGESGSIGGSLPTHRAGMWDAFTRALQPDRSARARAASDAFLTPGNAKSSVNEMLRFQAMMGKPTSAMQRILSAGLFADAAPHASQGLMQSR